MYHHFWPKKKKRMYHNFKSFPTPIVAFASFTKTHLLSYVALTFAQEEMASSGEKEMYFFCQRDRKYRNSARPNRVTKGGFWKATGTDRPIYSYHHGKCIIGLKKSLVFYRGRAAKGTKTEWMMHEFRLPSSLPLHSSLPSNKTTTTLLPSVCIYTYI